MSYLGNSGVSRSAAVVKVFYLTGDGVTVSFNLGYQIIDKFNLSVYIGGVYQHKDAFSISSSGTSIVFVEAPDYGSPIEVKLILDSGTSNSLAAGVVKLNNLDPSASSILTKSKKNYLINGNLDIWQRGTSITGSGYLADRWISNGFNATRTTSRISIPYTDGLMGTDYAIRTTVTVASGTHAVTYGQRVENLKQFSGKKVTLSFWARSPDSLKLGLEINRVYGQGTESMSNSEYGMDKGLIDLTPTWTRYSFSTIIPKLDDKVFGPSNHLEIVFWNSNGPSYASRSGTGIQLGTTDITRIQLEEGDVATDYEILPITDELKRCLRYYEVVTHTGFTLETAPSNYALQNSNGWSRDFYYKSVKRVTPTVSYTYSDSGLAPIPGIVSTIYAASIGKGSNYGVITETGFNPFLYMIRITADAEL